MSTKSAQLKLDVLGAIVDQVAFDDINRRWQGDTSMHYAMRRSGLCNLLLVYSVRVPHLAMSGSETSLMRPRVCWEHPLDAGGM